MSEIFWALPHFIEAQVGLFSLAFFIEYYYIHRARVLKPWVATQNWVAAYFVVGQRNDNGSHGSPTLQYIYIYIYIMKIFLTAFFFRKENFFLYESNMGRGTYTDTDNWVAAKIS